MVKPIPDVFTVSLGQMVVQGTLGEQTVQGWVVPKGEIEGDSESSVMVQMGANLQGEQSAMHHVDN